MNVLKRPPGDEFTFRLFFQLVNKIKKPKDVFYLWSTCIDPTYNQISHFIGTQQIYENEILYRNVITSSINTDLIVMGIKDHLTGNNFDPRTHTYTDMMLWLKQMAQHYSDKKIVLFTSLENLKLDEPNIIVIPWGGDITNHQREYLTVAPVDKNYDSTFSFLSLNRNARPHRKALVASLYNLGLDKYGMISCMFKDQMGIEPSIDDNYEIYTDNSNDNVNNFNNKLKSYYQDTFVEIVSETSYAEPAFNLTEKTLNSIYGRSFPIFISSTGTVEFLRSMGMDMFDDVVDHSYDNIDNPIDRLDAAINLNIDLLRNASKVKELHRNHINRFNQNINFAKDTMYKYYINRATDIFAKVIHEHNL